MMGKITLIGGAVFAAVIFVLALVVRHLNSELRVLKCKLAATEKAKDEYAAQAARLANAVDVMKKNKDEANEKINALDSGDSVDNAIGVLSKPKG